jgi:hypothetical protein
MGFLDILPIVGKIIDKIIPDPAAKAAAQLELMKLQQTSDFKEIDADLQMAQGQIDTNKLEASSNSLFKSGWRPFVGWVCGVALGTQFLIAPLCTWIATLAGYSIKFPSLDMGTLMTLLMSLLGLGGMRTTEKLAGKA